MQWKREKRKRDGLDHANPAHKAQGRNLLSQWRSRSETKREPHQRTRLPKRFAIRFQNIKRNKRRFILWHAESEDAALFRARHLRHAHVFRLTESLVHCLLLIRPIGDGSIIVNHILGKLSIAIGFLADSLHSNFAISS